MTRQHAFHPTPSDLVSRKFTAAVEHANRTWHLSVGGDPRPARSRTTYNVTTPITDEVVAQVPNGNADDVADAIGMAAVAANDWASRSARERGALVAKLADIVAENADEIAQLDCLNIGACISQMSRDVQASVDQLRMYGGLAMEQKGETIPASTNLHYTVRQPFGVVARITPFNHPAMFAATKIAAPLVAGNAVVLKPADIAPLSALRLGELFADALPAGVLSVVVGQGPQVPRALVRSPTVRRIGFIGSQATGRSIQTDAADTGVKYVSLELGGKNAMIVFPDADPGEAAAGAVRGMNFTWSGQSCGSNSRLLVHRDVADEVTSRVAELIDGLRIGMPFDPSSEVGTMASTAQYEKALSYIEVAQHEGAKVLSGGGRPDRFSVGRYVSPTLLGDVTPSMRVASEEVFGPVLSLLTFEDEADAVRIANGVEYGLTASVWTNDIRRAHRVAHALQAGYVWINGSAQHFLGTPFGGVKASGIGREESLDELLSYTESKAVHVLL